MSAETIACPDCGFVARIRRDVTSATLLYEIDDWQRRCKRRDVDGPAWCLVQRIGNNAGKKD